MILVLGLLVMRKQNQKTKKIFTTLFFLLVVTTLVGTGLFAQAEDKNLEGFMNFIGKSKTPPQQTNKNKKVGQTDDTFSPTEAVSADQAVAFPTDI